MSPSCTLTDGTFCGAEIEPGTFHSDRPVAPAPVRPTADEALIAPERTAEPAARG